MILYPVHIDGGGNAEELSLQTLMELFEWYMTAFRIILYTRSGEEPSLQI